MTENLLNRKANYVYDGANFVQEVIGGTNTANLLSGGIDEVFPRTDAAGTSNFLADALGSTVALADGSGNLSNQYTYEPFGNASVTGSVLNPYQYTGRENDATGLYFYRARYYNPTLQRFVSEDPIGFGSGVNFYAYTADDPVGFRDAGGLDYQVNYDPTINTVNVTATVTIYGPNATSTLAQSWQGDVNNYWNAGGFHYGKCNVRFDAKFFADPNHNWLFTASPKSDNYVNVIKQVGGERFLDETWSSYGRWLSGLTDQDVAHAMGHFFGLGDDYSLIFGTNKGHEGHMMTNDVIRNVAQHEVDDILSGRACGCKK